MSTVYVDTGKYNHVTGVHILEPFNDDGSGNLTPLEQGNGNVTAGASIALTSPQAALSASADTLYTFASAFKHFCIQNKSATNVYFEVDAVATVGSFLCYPNGQLLFFDIPGTVVHLYSTVATNVNGTADSNIVLKGWA